MCIDCITIIIAADTVVELNNRIMEKPSSKEDAKRMLKELSGTLHYAHTGVVIVEKVGSAEPEETCTFISSTKVKFAELSDLAMDAYVATGEPMDKSGAYGIQGAGRGLVEYVEGDFFNVAGFPCYDFSHHFSHRLEHLFPNELTNKKGRLE